MACMLSSHSNLSLSSSPPLIPHSRNLSFLSKPSALCFRTRNRRLRSLSVFASSASLEALIFDCDGVILESEHLHRQAYNDAFAHFNVRCSSQPLNWDLEFYDQLQNLIGGGKPKMRWSFASFLSLILWLFYSFSFSSYFFLVNWAKGTLRSMVGLLPLSSRRLRRMMRAAPS